MTKQFYFTFCNLRDFFFFFFPLADKNKLSFSNRSEHTIYCRSSHNNTITLQVLSSRSIIMTFSSVMFSSLETVLARFLETYTNDLHLMRTLAEWVSETDRTNTKWCGSRWFVKTQNGIHNNFLKTILYRADEAYR